MMINSPPSNRLASAVGTLLVDLASALHLQYNRRLVMALRVFLEAWGQIVERLDDGPTKKCHLQLIRLAKGQVKAWRLWLVEIRIERARHAASLPPSDTTHQGEVDDG